MELEKHLAQLKDPSPLVRQDALKAINGTGVAAVGPLLGLLTDMSLPPYTRAGAVKALGALGDGSCRQALEKALYSDDIVVQIPAAMALAKLKCQKSVPALLGALKHESGIMRKYAEDAIVSLVRSCKTPESLMSVRGYIGETVDKEGPSKALSRLSREIGYATKRLSAADTTGLAVHGSGAKKAAHGPAQVPSKVF